MYEEEDLSVYVYSGANIAVVKGDKIFTSKDGVTWQERQLPWTKPNPLRGEIS